MRTLLLLVIGFCLGIIVKSFFTAPLIKIDGVNLIVDTLNHVKLNPEEYSFDYVKGFEDCQRAIIAFLLKLKEAEKHE